MKTLEKRADIPTGTKVIAQVVAFARLAAIGRDRAACMEIARTPELAMIPVRLKEGEALRTLGSLVLAAKTDPDVAIEFLRNPEVAGTFDGKWTFGGLAVLNSPEAAGYVKEHGSDAVETDKAVVELRDLPACLSNSGYPHSLIEVASNPDDFRTGKRISEKLRTALRASEIDRLVRVQVMAEC